jgi:hypothetical protein
VNKLENGIVRYQKSDLCLIVNGSAHLIETTWGEASKDLGMLHEPPR